MKRMLLLVPLIIMLALLWRNGGEVNAASACPSPSPSCASTGTSTDLSGTLACTIVTTQSNGEVKVSLAQLTSAGDGTISSFFTVTNNNAASGSTFTTWTNKGTGTYCINSDESTGFIFPPSGANACPLALVIDATSSSTSVLPGTVIATEARLLDSTQNTAGTAVCELQ